MRKKLLLLLMILTLSTSLFTGCDDEPQSEEKKASTNEDEDDDDSEDNDNDDVASSIKVRNRVLSSSSGVRSPQVKLKGNGQDTVTIMMYVNGSNLESEDGEATTDLSEVIAGAGDSDKVNIVVQTMGTKKWQPELGVSAKETQRFKLDKNGLTKVSNNLGQLDCTKKSTLSDFIKWSAANYPADRYILIFWDHGGGSVYGFGYDEWQDEDATLTLDEMHDAFKDAGVYFDFIGMDCCIMATLETACAFYDFCDYSILCEDFESGLGWYYTDWISTLYDNTSISTEELGAIICNDMILANENNKYEGDEAIMSVIDEGNIKVLYQAWLDFAYANTDTLLESNFSRAMHPKQGGRVHPMIERYSLAEYYEVDIMMAAGSIDSKESAALKASMSGTIVYSIATKGDQNLSGIAVTLPYGDSYAYSEIKKIFPAIGFDKEYINWLGDFVDAEGYSSYYNYDDWDEEWDGWDDYDDDYDWDDWDCYYDDEYDDYDYGFDDFDYDDSYNCYYDDDDDDYYYYWDDYDDWYYYYDEDDDEWYYYDEDDDEWYYYDDDDWYDEDDDWYYDEDDDWYYYDDDDWYYDDDDDWYYYDDDDWY